MIAVMVVLSSIFMAASLSMSGSVQAVGVCDKISTANSDARAAAGCNDKVKTEAEVTQAILRVMYWAIITLAVIMIIVGGLMYVTSAGDPGKVAKAKTTIMIAVTGLVIGILASAIINFVIDTLVK